MGDLTRLKSTASTRRAPCYARIDATSSVDGLVLGHVRRRRFETAVDVLIDGGLLALVPLGLLALPILLVILVQEGIDYHRERRVRINQVRWRSATSLYRAPGFTLLKIAEFVYRRKTYEDVFLPTIVDFQEEYAEALADCRHWKARWVRLRGYASFFSAVAAHGGVKFAKLIVKVWKLFP